MKLINTTTFEISEFYDSKIPTYAILSHTWGEEEVSYQDWCSKAFPNKAGYEKIYSFCRICRHDGYEWAWVDTCCIDKTSSAELSEAINSMYRWYRGGTCYAYLVDVPTVEIDKDDTAFRSSRWFTRGWTLQELIAPGIVQFYSKEWDKIGGRGENWKIIESITGIPRLMLSSPDHLNKFSVAQKISWASKREATRTEDIAYCLIGLFDVNMPLLYGEGSKAFLRLQEEIMKVSADHTMFAWAAPDESMPKGKWRMDCGLLAPSPRYFVQSHLLIRKENPIAVSTKSYNTTNPGLKIELLLYESEAENLSLLAILNCVSLDSPQKFVAIRLEPATNNYLHWYKKAMPHEGDFVRIDCHKLDFLDFVSEKASLCTIYVQLAGGVVYRSASIS